MVDMLLEHYVKLCEGKELNNTIQMSVPLFIRCLEYAREDAKSDIELRNYANSSTS